MKRLIQNLIVASVGMFCAIYLLNPGGGFVEFIPDFVFGFGNIDEAAAILILMRCLAYFGIDLSFITRFRSGDEKPDPVEAEPVNRMRPEPKRAREKVIDV